MPQENINVKCVLGYTEYGRYKEDDVFTSHVLKGQPG